MPNKFNRNKKIPVRNNDEEVEFSSEMTLVLVISTIILGSVGVSIYNHLLRAEIIHDQLYRQDRRGYKFDRAKKQADAVRVMRELGH